MTVRFTSTGTYAASRARSSAYYAHEGGTLIGMVRHLSNGKWCAMVMVGGHIVAVSKIDMKNRTLAGEWLSEQIKERAVADASK